MPPAADNNVTHIYATEDVSAHEEKDACEVFWVLNSEEGKTDSQELPLTQLAIGQMVISKTNKLQDLGNLWPQLGKEEEAWLQRGEVVCPKTSKCLRNTAPGLNTTKLLIPTVHAESQQGEGLSIRVWGGER